MQMQDTTHQPVSWQRLEQRQRERAAEVDGKTRGVGFAKRRGRDMDEATERGEDDDRRQEAAPRSRRYVSGQERGEGCQRWDFSGLWRGG